MCARTIVNAVHRPELSIIVLSWDMLHLTTACIRSIRQAKTTLTYEVIIVDNGSEDAAIPELDKMADKLVLNGRNLGFARGNNIGTKHATAPVLMYLNNDTIMPPNWPLLVESLGNFSNAGIVVPALSAAGSPISVRDQPADRVSPIHPFQQSPSGVCYVLNRSVIAGLGGWNEGYPVASGEDHELAYTIWTNGLEIVLDERVLVEHIMHATSDTKLPDRRDLWTKNYRMFLERWADLGSDIPRLASCDASRFDWNRRIAAGRAVERLARIQKRELRKDASKSWRRRFARYMFG